MSEEIKKQNIPLQVYWQAAMPEWKKLICVIILACVSAFLEIIPFILSFYIVLEALSPSPQVNTVLWLTAAILGAILLRFAAQGGVTILGHMAAYYAECTLRCQLIERMKKVFPFSVEGKSAQLNRAVMDEVGRINGILAHTFPDLISGMFLFILCTVGLFIIDWRLTLAALVMFCIGLLAQKVMTNMSPELFENWVYAESRVSAALLFYMRGLATLRAYNRQASSLQEVKESIFAVAKLGGEITKKCSLYYAIFGLAMTTPLLVVLPCAFLLYGQGTLSANDMLLFVAISGVMFLPFTKVVMSIMSLRSIQTSASQIEKVLQLPICTAEKNAKSVNNTDITFENVSYNALTDKGIAIPLITRINFSLKAGSITTVTGPSGSGKTTLARLLARLDDVSEGRILIGGQDIRLIAPHELYSLMGIVFQDSYLFHGTIRENLLIAKPKAREKEIVQALEAAGCSEMLKDFALGLDTLVGDKGIGLSAGEQQRIAIARAFLKDAPILILDEASAHLDPIVEKIVSKSLQHFMQGKTVFVISHRLCDIANVDTSLVIVDGKLEAQGTHEHLLGFSPVYQRLWRTQEQAYSWRLGKDRVRGLK